MLRQNPYTRDLTSGLNAATAPQSVNQSAADISGAFTPSIHHPHVAGIQRHDILFDEEVLVHTKAMEREEVCQPLGIMVAHARVNISRGIHIRLTDPRDPFFLYSMMLLEDEYGRFKERHELNVDFNGFPQDLVSMLQGAGHRDASGGGHGISSPLSHTIHFISDGTQGTLRIMERTGFRSLEHISLQLNRQGDVGQKQYLAERFKYFEATYLQCSREKMEECEKYEKMVAELQGEAMRLTQDRDILRQKLQLEASEAEAAMQGASSQLKDAHLTELRRLHADHEAERSNLLQRINTLVEDSNSQLASKAQELTLAEGRERKLTQIEKELREQVSRLTDERRSQQAELQRLNSQVTELTVFRTEATKQQTNNDLQNAQTSERLRHLTQMLSSRDEEVASLKRQHQQQGEYAQVMKDQFESSQKKLDSLESSLAKAHHIIGNQLQSLKTAKEKQTSLQQQLQHAETLANERALTVERQKSESIALQERLELLQQRVADYKEQLLQAEQQRTALSGQLKQCEEAMLHMQRLQSGSGTRSYTNPSAPSSSFGHHGHSAFTAPSAIYREFARGAQSQAATAGTTFSMPPSSATQESIGKENTRNSANVQPPFQNKISIPSSAPQQPVQSAYFPLKRVQ